MLNKVQFIGRLGADPEVKDVKDGGQMVTLNIATTETFPQNGERKEVTDWHRVVAFRHIADFAAKYLSKGRLVYVEGKLKTRSWEDEDGNKKYLTEVRATEIKPLDSKKSED